MLFVSFIPFAINVVRSLRSPPTAGADPWEANSLEWATSSPPPEHNFTWLPPIRSERPVFDLRWSEHPDVAAPGHGRRPDAGGRRRRSEEEPRREAGDAAVGRRHRVLHR